MDGRSNQLRKKRIITISAVLIGVFVLYFLSMGPVFVLMQEGRLNQATYNKIYKPFEYLVRRIDVFNEVVNVYVGIWKRPEFLRGLPVTDEPAVRESVSTKPWGRFYQPSR
jgi:hypothetical protein